MTMQKAKFENTKTEQAFQVSNTDPIFGIAKQNGKYIIVAGKYKVSLQEFDTIQEAENYIAAKPYELIINTCAATILNVGDIQNESKNKKQNA